MDIKHFITNQDHRMYGCLWLLGGVGGYQLAKGYLFKPLIGIWKHFIRPRRNTKARFSTEWALVTGASNRIGKAFCYELAKCKINVSMVSRTESKMNEIA